MNIYMYMCVHMSLYEYVYLLLFLVAYSQSNSGKPTGFPSDTCITNRIVNYFQHSLNCQYVSWKEPRFISRYKAQFACNLLTKKVHYSIHTVILKAPYFLLPF